MTKLIAGLGIAGLLLSAAPMAMADQGSSSVSGQATVSTHEDNGLHLGWFIGKHKGEDKDKLEHASSTASTTKERDGDHKRTNAHVVGGTVGTVNGSTFTLGSTTVTTNTGTKIVSRDGATTTAAITAGSHVLVFGSTTATSTSGTSFTADVVIVLGKAWGGLKHLLHF